MRFRVLFALLLPMSLWATEPSHPAGTWLGVKVLEVKACTPEGCPPKGRVIVKLSAGATGSPPSCSSSYRNWVAINIGEAGGAFAASLMQAARLTGMSISVEGTGSCSLASDIETAATVAGSE